MSVPQAIFLGAVAIVLWWIYQRIARSQRARFIDEHRLPSALSKAVLDAYPSLTTAQVQRVLLGLKQFFQLCNTAGNKMVAMPSQVVDVAWHQYILNTRQYQQFCQQAFARFLHHTPSEAMQSKTVAQEGIKRAWRLACAKEGINPKTPSHLPLLFALDAELGITNGFVYTLDCSKGLGAASNAYCASHIGCSSGCSGSSGSDSHADSGCSSGDGGGCGGGD